MQHHELRVGLFRVLLFLRLRVCPCVTICMRQPQLTAEPCRNQQVLYTARSPQSHWHSQRMLPILFLVLCLGFGFL